MGKQRKYSYKHLGNGLTNSISDTYRPPTEEAKSVPMEKRIRLRNKRKKLNKGKKR